MAVVSGIAFARFTFTPNAVVGSRIPPLSSALRFQTLVLTLILICFLYHHVIHLFPYLRLSSDNAWNQDLRYE